MMGRMREEFFDDYRKRPKDEWGRRVASHLGPWDITDPKGKKVVQIRRFRVPRRGQEDLSALRVADADHPLHQGRMAEGPALPAQAPSTAQGREGLPRRGRAVHGRAHDLFAFYKNAAKVDKDKVLAVSIAGGTEGWREEYNKWFAGLEVVIIPDHDEPGMKFAADGGAQPLPVAKSVSIMFLYLSPEFAEIAKTWMPKAEPIEVADEHGLDFADWIPMVRDEWKWDPLTTFPCTSRCPAEVTSEGDLGEDLENMTTVIRLSTAAPKPIDWLWRGRFARGSSR